MILEPAASQGLGEQPEVCFMVRGGASSAVRAQCNYLGVWPYFEILGAPRGIMVTPSVDFDF